MVEHFLFKGTFRFKDGTSVLTGNDGLEGILKNTLTTKHDPDKFFDYMGAKSLLDYGCGKAQHHPEDWNAYKYDPAYPKYDKKPEAGRKFDLVICIDVLEHIPQADLPRIIKEIFDYSGKYVFATAATSKAGKTLPNGMNAHATVQPEEWWNELFAQYYEDPYKKFTLD